MWLLAGCVAPLDLQGQLAETERSIVEAYRNHGADCAPVPLARAQANLDFSRLELNSANLRRAADHLALADQSIAEARETSAACLGMDADKDTIADVLDRCPDSKEDLDGLDDDDGCYDIDLTGDMDGDGVANIDDGCIAVPEDRDGVYDDDGCPETDEDNDGDGVVDAVDACEGQTEDRDKYRDEDGCPEPDNDNDKILDIVDKCPNQAEDSDGWADEDGCPDGDNDGDGVADGDDLCRNAPGPRDRGGCPTADGDRDGIADLDDRCPTEPETSNDYLDDDGCPDHALVGIRVTQTRVETDGSVQFESGSAVLLTTSYATLNTIARVMNDAPYLQLRIEGHTDNAASEEANLDLSRERAVTVLRYLVAQGIQEYRLQAEGFGETRPVDSNRTAEGRSRNRRVEFHIVE